MDVSASDESDVANHKDPFENLSDDDPEYIPGQDLSEIGTKKLREN